MNGTTAAVYFDDVLLSMAMYESNSAQAQSDEDVVYSEGFSFVSKGDGTCFIGERKDCTDTVIVIPPTSPAGDSIDRK